MLLFCSRCWCTMSRRKQAKPQHINSEEQPPDAASGKAQSGVGGAGGGRGAAAGPNFPDARRRRPGRRGALPGGAFSNLVLHPPPFSLPFPPPSTGSARNPTPSSPQGFGGGGGHLNPRGAPTRCCFAGLSGAPTPRCFGGGSGRFWAAAGARCCPRGASPCPAGGPPPPRPPMPRTPECRGTRVGGAGLRRPRCLGGCSLMGGEPQSFPKAEGIAGRGGGGERKELRTIFAGVGNGWSVVPSIYLRLSR